MNSIVTLKGIESKRPEKLGMRYNIDMGDYLVWYPTRNTDGLSIALVGRDEYFSDYNLFSESVWKATKRGFQYISICHYSGSPVGNVYYETKRKPIGPWIRSEVGPGFPGTAIRLYFDKHTPWRECAQIYIRGEQAT